MVTIYQPIWSTVLKAEEECIPNDCENGRTKWDRGRQDSLVVVKITCLGETTPIIKPLRLTTWAVSRKVTCHYPLKIDLQLSMEGKFANCTTPGGTQSTVAFDNACGPLDSGEPAPTCFMDESEHPENTGCKIKSRQPIFFATFNANSLLKVGKLKHLTDTLTQHKIELAAIQETRFIDEHAFESQGYRILKGKVGQRVMKNVPHLGTGFLISHKILDSVVDFTSPNSRLSILSLRCANKGYTLVNVHAPTNQDNKLHPDRTDKFWEELEGILSKIPERHTIILLGDFNAQLGREKKYNNIVGNYPAHMRTNRNGERLVELCRTFGLVMKSTAFKHLPRKQKTWISPNFMLGEFQIDHVAISRKSHQEILNVKVLRSANLDSDHYLSKIKLRLRPRNTRLRRKSKVVKFDIERLKNNQDVSQRLNNMEFNNWNQLKDALVTTASELAPPMRRKKHLWWTEDCDRAIAQRQAVWLRWNSNKNKVNWENFIEQRQLTSKLIRGIKRTYTNNQLTQIEENFVKNNTRDFYKTFKQSLRKYSPPSLHFRDLQGKMVFNDRDNCRLLAQYFKELLNCDPPREGFEYQHTSPNPDSLPPSREEICEIIQHLKNNKAAGEDSIVGELWKCAGSNAENKLTEIIQNIWETEVLPPDWTSAIIHPLHKKGDFTDLNNYRGISLVPVTYKIFSKSLLTRTESQLDSQIGEYQGGFRKSRSCVEQIFNLKNVIAYSKVRNRGVVVTFVDFRKAYDSIDRETLDKILQELGLDNKTRRLILLTLTNTHSKVKFRGEISDSFEIKTGVRQGDGLSPILFNCALEKVVREWRKELTTLGIQSGISLGRKTNGLFVDCLAFADDMALIADSMDTALIQINCLRRQAAKVGLQVSLEKTEFFTNIKEASNEMLLEQGKIRRTEKFKYLGEWIESNLSEKAALSMRVNKLEMAYRLTKNTYNKKCLSRNLKLKHYQSVIRPEALYAMECLSLNRRGLVEKMEIRERRILRKILGPVKVGEEYRRRHNSELYEHIEKLSDCARKRRVAFYGHIKRLPATRLTNRLLSFWNNKKIRTTWVMETEKDIKELAISDIHDRLAVRCALKGVHGFQEKPRKKGTPWTLERKEIHRQKMRQYWAKIKTQQQLNKRGPK